MDYSKFLAKTEEVVLPYLGGPFVETGTRRLRVEGEAIPGYVRFAIQGRKARVMGLGEPIDLSARPVRVGHFISGYLASTEGTFTRLALLPSDEPLPLSPVRARVWHDNALIFEETPFESESEESARLCLEESRALGDLKGIGASLRAAFAVGLAMKIARRRDIALSPIELKNALLAIAGEGEPRVTAELDRIQEARAEHVRAATSRAEEGRLHRVVQRNSQRAPQNLGTLEDAEDRASRALAVFGGRLLSSRRQGSDFLEVRYELFGERFVTVVDALTLGVIDAGICLDGADSEVTLESLPSVIREAIDTDQLVITSR